MSLITHQGVNYEGTYVPIQSDPTATSLDTYSVPTGGTITSALNSNVVTKPSSLQTAEISSSASRGFTISCEKGSNDSAGYHLYQLVINQNGVLTIIGHDGSSWATIKNIGDDSGWIEDTLTAFGTGKVQYRKSFNTINFFLVNQNLTGMTANASNVIYTLPSAYYPHNMIVARNYNDNGFIQINTNGTVVVNPTSTSGWFSVCLTYLTA